MSLSLSLMLSPQDSWWKWWCLSPLLLSPGTTGRRRCNLHTHGTFVHLHSGIQSLLPLLPLSTTHTHLTVCMCVCVLAFTFLPAAACWACCLCPEIIYIYMALAWHDGDVSGLVLPTYLPTYLCLYSRRRLVSVLPDDDDRFSVIIIVIGPLTVGGLNRHAHSHS